LAVSHNYFVPEQHMIASISRERLYNDFKKFELVHVWYPIHDNFERTCMAFTSIFSPLLCNSKILSYEEAVSRAERSTSPGYLYKKMGYRTKGEVFDKYGIELRRKVDNVFLGVNEKTIYETAPKVEVRPLDKLFNDDLDKRKQRTFMVADTLNYIIALMLYSDFNDKFHKQGNDDRHWSSIGSSIFYGGWNRVAMKMARKQKVSRLEDIAVRCFDVSHMEACHVPPFQEFLYNWKHTCINGGEFAKNWFQHHKMYGLLIDVFGFLCMKVGINPSGCLNTLDDNTFLMIFNKLYNISFHYPTVQSMIEKYFDLAVECMGDDSICEEDPLWDTYIDNSKHLGITITYEIDPPTSIFQAKFLNFGFSYDLARSVFFQT